MLNRLTNVFVILSSLVAIVMAGFFMTDTLRGNYWVGTECLTALIVLILLYSLPVGLNYVRHGEPRLWNKS